MDYDLNDLKKYWTALTVKKGKLDDTNRELAGILERNNILSLQSKLASRVSRNGWKGFILIVFAPILYYEIELPWWVAVTYATFGVIMAVLSLCMAEYIRAVSLTDLSVAEAILRVTKIRKAQLFLRITGISLGVSLITMIGCTIPPGPDQKSLFIGGAIGLAIGAAIGAARCLTNIRITRQLRRSLELIND